MKFAAHYWDSVNNYMKSEKIKATPKKPIEKIKWFDVVKGESADCFAFFNRFRESFDKGAGRESASEQWLLLWRKEKGNEEFFKHVVYAAGVTAKNRPSLLAQNISAIHMDQWLKKSRFDDVEPLKEAKTKAITDANAEQRRELMSAIEHYRRQLKITNDNHWKAEIEKAENDLKELNEGGL